jgi:outer membrane protein assembly factor BamB
VRGDDDFAFDPLFRSPKPLAWASPSSWGEGILKDRLNSIKPACKGDEMKLSKRFAIGVGVSLCLLISATIENLAQAGAEPFVFKAGNREIHGGLVVVLDATDAKQLGGFAGDGSFLVHGLVREREMIASLRAEIAASGQSGRVTVDIWNGTRIPLVANTVNVLVSSATDVTGEMRRALAPNGVVITPSLESTWRKPWTEGLDEWTHYLHGPGNNAVAKDTVVGPPRRLQWHAGPKWSRHHDHMSSMSAMVSAGGKAFYILDEGSRKSLLLPPDWKLIARDAFNGTLLWKRDLGKWNDALWPLKSGPANLPRRLVATADMVFAPRAFDLPVVAIDAETGTTRRTFEGTVGAEELLLIDGILLTLVNDALISADVEKVTVADDADFFTDSRVTKYPHGRKVWSQVQSEQWLQGSRTIVAHRAVTGEPLWRKPSQVVPLTLAADSERVYFHDGDKLIAVDRTNGKQLWRSESVPIRRIESWFAPTLVVVDGVALFSGGEEVPHSSQGWRGGDGIDTLTAFDAKTGKRLWTGDHPFSGYQSPEDLLVIDGLVWAANIAKNGGDGVFIGRNLRTGEIEKEITPNVNAHWFHHRCHRAKATENFFLTSRTGIETIDTKSGDWTIHHWVRGACLYGIMPANGLIYTPPHPCSCYGQAKLFGFNALAPARDKGQETRDEEDANRLMKGPAYEATSLTPDASNLTPRASRDWPTYRGDAARSGNAAARLSTSLKPAKSIAVGNDQSRFTQPVVARGVLLIANIDDHAVLAYDARTGQRLWRFVAGGRVDSPPTVHKGRVLFGSADGSVYCLRLSDGEICWQFQAAPTDERLVSCDQIESVWPVHGSVLVEHDVAYFVAGRSYFLDGGVRLWGLDPKTGEVVVENVLDESDPVTGENFQSRIRGLSMPVALTDILSSSGDHLFMRSQAINFDGKREDVGIDHLFAPFGFLDHSGFHRTYWIYGDSYNGTIGGYGSGKSGVGARLMVHDDKRVYAFGRKPEYFRWSSAYEYQLFAVDAIKKDSPAGKGGAKKKGAANWKPAWTQDPPFVVRAMVLTEDALFIAGVPSFIVETDAIARLESNEIKQRILLHDASLKGEKGGMLWAVSTEDGGKLAEFELESAPTFDGMVAAGGKLYITTAGGEVLTFEGN